MNGEPATSTGGVYFKKYNASTSLLFRHEGSKRIKTRKRGRRARRGARLATDTEQPLLTSNAGADGKQKHSSKTTEATASKTIGKTAEKGKNSCTVPPDAEAPLAQAASELLFLDPLNAPAFARDDTAALTTDGLKAQLCPNDTGSLGSELQYIIDARLAIDPSVTASQQPLSTPNTSADGKQKHNSKTTEPTAFRTIAGEASCIVPHVAEAPPASKPLSLVPLNTPAVAGETISESLT
ncbi:hypothetical protein DXG03_005794, partial [Asterophora parasitica]